MRDDESTLIMDDDATQVLDDDATQVMDDDATQTMDQAIKTLSEIVKGDVIKGYTVGEPISEKGGEAVIRVAEKDGKKYAIKVFRSGHSTDRNTEDVLVKLKSPYVMPILDRGDYKGIHYEILPFYHNGTFGDLLGKEIGYDRLMMFIRDVNEGLQAIHKKNVFHNDIKPENVFISDDRKSAVIGDFGISRFGAERTHVTNIGNMTKYYAAPEADEMSNAKTDYFSFGMSIANLAFGKKLFDGLTGKRAREEIIQGRLSLPKEIPDDVRDLITMLTKYNPQERIAYDGVCRWLKNPMCFAGCRDQAEQTDTGLIINLYRFGEKGSRKEYRDTYLLAAAMNDNQELAMPQHRDEFILNAVKTAPQQDPQLYDDLLQIHTKYKNDLAFGLFLTLHTLNPNLPVKFAGKEMRDFQDYIDMLQRDYGNKIDEHFAHEEFLTVLLNHSNIADSAAALIQSVIKSYKTPIDLFDIFLNLFGSSKKFYYDNVIYDGFGDFLNKRAFSDKGLPNAMKWEKMRVEFLSAYLDKLGADKKTIESILHEKDQTTEYFMLGKVLNGYIPLRLCGMPVNNFHGFVELIAKIKEAEKSTELAVIKAFLGRDGFSKIVRFEKNPIEKGLADIIERANNKISYIYYYCYPGAKFMGCTSLNDLVKLLGAVKSDKIETQSKEILESEDFKIWMETKGVKV